MKPEKLIALLGLSVFMILGIPVYLFEDFYSKMWKQNGKRI